MPKHTAPKSWAEEIAELDNPAPKDFDPEESPDDEERSGSSDSNEDNGDVREHYEDVGKSTLRRPDHARLGPQYKGSTISRGDFAEVEKNGLRFAEFSDEETGSELDDDDTSDQTEDEQAVGDDEEPDGYEGFEHENTRRIERSATRNRNSFDSLYKKDRRRMDAASDFDFQVGLEDNQNMNSVSSHGNNMNPELESVDAPQSEGEDFDMKDKDSISNKSSDQSTPNSSLHIDSPSSAPQNDRAALREMMAESQNAIISTISKAAKADLEKGKAIKHQRATFDAFLNTRIRLQKALVATNSLSFPQNSSANSPEDLNDSIIAAEAAALKLWNQLDNLRRSLRSSSSSDSPKAPFRAAHATTTSAIWSHMQGHDAASLPIRRTTLTKWSTRLQPAMPSSQRTSISQHLPPTPLTALLDQQLLAPNATRLLNRTRTPRSCAPLQAAAHTPLDATIYDDTDFYTQLLRELVEQRMADSALPTANPVDDATSALASGSHTKVRKVVDTKASKGRKMRYTVHEKLQNFMPPEDRGTWGERQTRELFASLLGKKSGLENRNGDGLSEGEGTGMTRKEEALMLFRR